MSRSTLKTRTSLLGTASTVIPGAYNAANWVAELNCVGLDEIVLLLDFTTVLPDAGTISIMSLVEDPDNLGNFYAEVNSGGSLDELSVSATLVNAHGGRIAANFDCSRFNRVRFLAKKVGGTVGELALSAVGG